MVICFIAITKENDIPIIRHIVLSGLRGDRVLGGFLSQVQAGLFVPIYESKYVQQTGEQIEY